MRRLALLLLAVALLPACHRKSPTPSRDDTRSSKTRPTPATPSPNSVPTVAINAPTLQPLAPPALARAPSTPALPDLPPLSQHPKQSAPPPSGPDVHGCGQVWSGTEWIPVACIDPGSYPRASKMAKVVVPYDSIRVPAAHLPAVVDHRADGTEGPVRKQRGPECTAFALTSAMDHALARWTGSPGNFSVMQVWARYVRLNEKAAADDNVGQYLSNEVDWPYDGPTANSWIRCPTGGGARAPCGRPVDQARLDALEKRPFAELTQIQALSTSELDVLRVKMAAGQDATVAVALPSFATAGAPGSRYVVGSARGRTAAPRTGHQILLAGYAMLPHGTYYLIHNSWGPSWGDNGFAWIHEETLKAHWHDARIYLVDVEPVAVARRKTRARGALTAPCPGDQLPDSISGLCANRCGDGSPRHNDVCPVAGQCRAGQVNLTGECQLAAPAGASGTDPASRVRWACGPGGCAYWLPQGQAGCAQRECSVSCPAPDFRLATGPKGLLCVE